MYGKTCELFFNTDVKGKAMNLEELLKDLNELQEKSDALDQLKASNPALEDLFGIVDQVFPMLGAAKIMVSLAKYVELTPADLASLQVLKKD